MQVDGQKAVTLGPGATFHEGPADIHRQSANASATQPAKFPRPARLRAQNKLPRQFATRIATTENFSESACPLRK
jgi:hypothetical protein